MNDFTKEWKKEDFYNVDIEFNRLGAYNEYCKKWIDYFFVYQKSKLDFQSKTDWKKEDFPTFHDYNDLKKNINMVSEILESKIGIPLNRLPINNQKNQFFSYNEANELEQAQINTNIVGQIQFSYKITGLNVCGQNDIFINFK